MLAITATAGSLDLNAGDNIKTQQMKSQLLQHPLMDTLP